MKISEIKQEIYSLKDGAYSNYQEAECPSKTESCKGFFRSGCASLHFIFSEKENILFALLQLAVVGLGYFLWTQMLNWIPQEVWDEIKNDCDDGASILDIILLVWSFVCVGIVAYPLGILTSCMGASYILRFQGKPSTIAECLKIVMHRSWTMWIFSWLDGWWTVLRILERLPKKNDRTPRSVKIRNEIIYQAWKMASLGFMPALICGRSVSEACKDSLSLLKNKFVQLAKLRLGYSAICWILAIACYLGTFILMATTQIIPKMGGEHNTIYSFYFITGFPVVVTLTFIMVIFRPIYIISACRIYAFYTREKNIEIKLPETSSKVISSLIAFTVLLIIIAVVVLYRDQLGLSEILANPWKIGTK